MRPAGSWQAVGFLCLLVLALIASNAAEVALSYATRDYMTALAQQDRSGFMKALLRALLLLALATPTRSCVELATGGLSIAWRRTLTSGLMAEYFQERAVYWLRSDGRVKDPDMRIGIEAGRFCDSASLMLRDVLENAMRLLGFAGVVYAISGPLCAAMVVYATSGAIATVLIFGRPLVDLDRGIRARESALRAALARSSDRAEALAFSAGEAAEERFATARFSKLESWQWRRVRWRTALASFRDVFTWVASLLPVAFVGPLWLRGEVSFGVLAQTSTAFQASLTALAVVVRKFRSVSSLVAEGARLDDLAKALARSHLKGAAQSIELRTSAEGVSVDGLTLRLPEDLQARSEQALASELSFMVQPGDRLLISAPSGAGKTTILRALAGLWTEGSGKISRAKSAIFLPQDPYLPEGTLRRILTFPAASDVFSDDAVLAAAQAACLGDILARHRLDEIADWEAVLSRGEQQRCAFCRLLLQRPSLAVLDEATSALDEETESALYTALRDGCDGARRCVVSVGHRPSLRTWHSHLLCQEAGGTWIYEALPD